MATELEGLFYADASALVKLVIEEAETEALKAHLGSRDVQLATSRIAVVEVPRATALADGSPEARAATFDLLDRCLLVDVTDPLLRRAEQLTSARVRTLDAIHLASALRVEPDEVLAYDARLRVAAEEIGLTVAAPGDVA